MPYACRIVKIVCKLTQLPQGEFCFCVPISPRRGGTPRCAPIGLCEEGRAVRDLIGFGRRLLTDDSGATSIEYAIIAGSLSIVILAAVTSVGSTVNLLFASILAGF